MKLVTLQNKRVLDIINTDGEYIPLPKYNLMDEEYKEMFEQYTKKIGIPIEAAIWGWYAVDFERTDKLPNDQLLGYMENFYFDDSKDVAILLNIPDELVFLSDAYAWGIVHSRPTGDAKRKSVLVGCKSRLG